jgi:hypothetical protein
MTEDRGQNPVGGKEKAEGRCISLVTGYTREGQFGCAALAAIEDRILRTKGKGERGDTTVREQKLYSRLLPLPIAFVTPEELGQKLHRLDLALDKEGLRQLYQRVWAEFAADEALFASEEAQFIYEKDPFSIEEGGVSAGKELFAIAEQNSRETDRHDKRSQITNIQGIYSRITNEQTASSQMPKERRTYSRIAHNQKRRSQMETVPQDHSRIAYFRGIGHQIDNSPDSPGEAGGRRRPYAAVLLCCSKESLRQEIAGLLEHLGDRIQIPEDRGQRTEDRFQRTENRGQRAEGRIQRIEDGIQRTVSVIQWAVGSGQWADWRAV